MKTSKRQHRSYTAGFKAGIIQQIKNGKTIPEVARANKVPVNSIRNWAKQAKNRVLAEALKNSTPATAAKNTRTNKRYTVQFKAACLRMVEKGYKVSAIAKANDIHPNRIHYWVRQASAGKSKAVAYHQMIKGIFQDASKKQKARPAKTRVSRKSGDLIVLIGTPRQVTNFLRGKYSV